MKGIRLENRAVFVTDGSMTVRLLPNGECGISPVLYSVLEWDLRTERPDTWEYLTEGELACLPDGGMEKILAAFAKAQEALGIADDKGAGDRIKKYALSFSLVNVFTSEVPT